jgi:rubrerythrin
MNFLTLDDVLIFAIRKEHDAHRLYMDLSERARDPGSKRMLKDLSDQELGHKNLLENVRRGHELERIGGHKEVKDLGLAEFLVSDEIGPESPPQDILRYAIKMEESSHLFYRTLRDNYANTPLEGILSRLAREELSHKEALEREYEEHFMQWM